jgi:hypothetical protein
MSSDFKKTTARKGTILKVISALPFYHQPPLAENTEATALW